MVSVVIYYLGKTVTETTTPREDADIRDATSSKYVAYGLRIVGRDSLLVIVI